MNSYEASEVFNVGNAHEVILGQKAIDPFKSDVELGPQWFYDDLDIDESDE